MRVVFVLALVIFAAGCGLFPERKEITDEDAYRQYESALTPKIYDTVPAEIDVKAKYIFYLHGRIVEDQGAEAVSQEFGHYEYHDILETLAGRGFVIISEVRPKDTDVKQYAAKVVEQVNALLKANVPPGSVTVVGASKGGGITMAVSSELKSKNVNFVILAACATKYPAGTMPNLYGNVLSIYDYKDDKGVGTCRQVFSASKGLNKHKEIELKVGTGHGILYQPIEEWVEPTVAWAGGNYE